MASLGHSELILVGKTWFDVVFKPSKLLALFYHVTLKEIQTKVFAMSVIHKGRAASISQTWSFEERQAVLSNLVFCQSTL